MSSPAKSRRRIISLEAAAAEADISTRTIRRRIADGTLPAYRVGRLLKVDAEDLDRLIVPVPAA